MRGFDFPREENRRLSVTRRGAGGYFLAIGVGIGVNWDSALSIPIIFVVVIIQI